MSVVHHSEINFQIEHVAEENAYLRYLRLCPTSDGRVRFLGGSSTPQGVPSFQFLHLLPPSPEDTVT